MFHTDQLWIDPAYAAALRAAGLADVDAILERIDGEVAAWSRSTDTLQVAGTAGRPGFYLKRYHYPSWRKRIRTMFRGTFFGVHRGAAEFRALQTMRALGISACRPVAFGARRVGHFVSACVLITEEVPAARNLTTFAQDVAEGRLRVDRRQRLAMVDELAARIADLHAAGFSHGQLFWRNILIRLSLDRSPEFFFLDAQPMPVWRRLSSGLVWWQVELAQLLVSAAPFTTRTERLRFFKRYLNAERLNGRLKQQARCVAAAAAGLQRHETQRIKMNALFNRWNCRLQEERASRASSGRVLRISSGDAL